MIVNLRGPSGAGKTEAARAFMEHCGVEATLVDGYKGKPEAYLLKNGIYVLGNYTNNCGGMDAYGYLAKGRSDEWCDLVRKYAALGNVFFEGLLISHVFSRWFELSKELKEKYGHQFVWAFLDTPPEVCIQQVYQRNGGKPINEKNITDKHEANLSTAKKAHDEGERVVGIDHTRTTEALCMLFEVPYGS